MDQPSSARAYIVREHRIPPAHSCYVHDIANSGVSTYEGSYDQLPVWDKAPELFTLEEALEQLEVEATDLYRPKHNVQYVLHPNEAINEDSIRWDGPGYYSTHGECLYTDGSHILCYSNSHRLEVVKVEIVPHELGSGYELREV